MNLSLLSTKFLILFALLSLSVLGCRSKKKLTQVTPKKIPTSVNEFVEDSEVFDKSFTGFSLYDPKRKKSLYEYQSDKYFTPASNTKIFTLYAALEILGDSIPALQYVIQNDSLIFWGTGDPSFLHPELLKSEAQIAVNQRVINFLKNKKEQLFFSAANFKDERYGVGWAWDDFSYSFQPEKSSFPIHGNTVLFQNKLDAIGIDVFPKPFEAFLFYSPALGGVATRFQRKEFDNVFQYNVLPPLGQRLKKEIPFRSSPEFVVELLSLILEKEITYLPYQELPQQKATTIYSVPVDTLYEMMMQESDNFVAEQLLLGCSNLVFEEMNTRKIIKYFSEEYLKDLPDPAVWRDGSGLSRYNLFTPRTVVKILEKIYSKIPEERIFRIFPTGKKEGTLQNWYAPYVHAKTGTLSNKHCLSGFIKTKKGNTLIFSFMHNNYIGSSSPLKEEMEKILNFIYLKM